MLGYKALSQHAHRMCDSIASHRSLIIPAPTPNPKGRGKPRQGPHKRKGAPEGPNREGADKAAPNKGDNKTEEDMNPYRLILYNTSADWDVDTPAL